MVMFSVKVSDTFFREKKETGTFSVCDCFVVYRNMHFDMWDETVYVSVDSVSLLLVF